METNKFGERLGEVFGTICWLWVFWRFKQDGKVLLGMEHPWDHGHDHGDGGHDAIDKKLRVQGLMHQFSVKSQTKQEMVENWDTFTTRAMNPGDDDDDDDDDDEDEDEDGDNDEEDDDDDDDDE